MNQLHELTKILGDRPLLTPDNEAGKHAKRLLRWIRKTDDPTDEKARQALSLVKNGAAYRKIKYHLRIYLLNSVTACSTFKLDKNPDRRSANQQVWHQLSAILAAPGLFQEHQGNGMLGNLMVTAAEHDLQDPLTISKVHGYLHEMGKEKRDSSSQAEAAVKEVYNGYIRGVTRKQMSLSTYINGIRLPISEKVVHLQDFIDELETFSDFNYHKVTTKKLYHQIKISLYQNDLDAAKKIHAEAANLLTESIDNNRTTLYNFHNNLLRCFIKSESPMEGLQFAQRIIIDPHIREFQRLAVLELMLILAMKSEEYQESISIYNELTTHPMYQKLNENRKETIEIIKAYISLLIGAGIIHNNKSDDSFSKFRIQRFLNGLTFSQKEKSLRNTHALIIKLLNHCINKREQDFTLFESIRKYTQRHLNDPIYYRTKNFLLLLSNYPENGFDLHFTLKQGKKYLEKMKTRPPEGDSIHAYTEIIPYERLWNIVISVK